MSQPIPDKAQLWDEVKNYVATEVDCAKYSVTESATVITAKICLSGVVALLAAIALFFLACAVTEWLTALLGSPIYANLIVAAFFIICIVLVVAFRRKLIVNPLARLISKSILNPKE